MGQELPGKTENPKETLDRILAALKSGNAQTQRAAILELGTIHYSSPAIVAELERIALTAEDELRALALTALEHSASRAVYKQKASLSPFDRQVILKEINIWQKDGLLDEAHAMILNHRYGSDLAPATQANPQPAPASLRGRCRQRLPPPSLNPLRLPPSRVQP